MYTIAVKATPAGVLQTIPLATPVRQPLAQRITVSNPLDNDVAVAITCDKPEVLAICLSSVFFY